jgi:lipid A 3-O-deacylase
VSSRCHSASRSASVISMGLRQERYGPVLWPSDHTGCYSSPRLPLPHEAEAMPTPLPPPALVRHAARTRSSLLAAVAVLAAIAPATAAPRLLGPALTLLQENDLVVETDRHYTQGLKLVYLAGEADAAEDILTARAARALPVGNVNLEAARYGLGVGQVIFTPKNLKESALQVDERPYAGYLFVAAVLQRRGVTRDGHDVLDHFELDLGVIGPESLAENAQNTVHRLRSFPLARGWDNQIRTEPGGALRLERRARLTVGDGDGFAAQFLPHAGASLGNVATFGSLGALVRTGWRLPPDFGAETIDSLTPVSGGRPRGDASPGLGGYIFAELEGRAVGHNAFLDGNTARDSHSVSKEPVVGDLRFGVALVSAHCDLSYTQVIRSREFEGQRGADAFGSLALTLKW